MPTKSRKGEGETRELVEFLRAVPILHGLDDDALRSLAKDSTKEAFPPGGLIVRDGSPLADLYIVLQGRVEVKKKGAVITSLKNGQFFGEMAFLNELPTGRSADIVATEETSCLRLKGAVWYAFLRKNPDVAIEVIRVLSARLRETDWTLGALQNLPAAKKD